VLSGFLLVALMERLNTWVITHGMKVIFRLLCLSVGVWNVWRIGKNGSFGIYTFVSNYQDFPIRLSSLSRRISIIRPALITALAK